MKILTVVGARPQFVKAAVLSRLIAEQACCSEIIIHTGQHFDDNMSKIFFNQMEIPQPDHNLNINSLSHGAMTGRMIQGIEELILIEKPDWVVVYGDTNSTLAGALAAKKLKLPVAHIESGLRSYNREMPEEINRILTDKISDFLFCPTIKAIENLKSEGFCPDKVFLSGDIMYDAFLHYLPYAKKPSEDIPDSFLLATVHRPENTTNKDRLFTIFSALNDLAAKYNLVIPLHPRTAQKIRLADYPNITFIKPVGYFQMIYLLKACSLVLTDSGGLQKEAYFAQKPCVTMRDQTEWVELVEHGFNILTGSDKHLIISAANDLLHSNLDYSYQLYGKGNAGVAILDQLLSKDII